MPKYKVTDKSYGNYNGNLKYSYAFDTDKYSGIVRDVERTLKAMERIFYHLPGEFHFPFDKPIGLIDARALINGAYVAPIRAIFKNFNEKSSEHRANKQKDAIAEEARKAKSIRALINELNKLNKLFQKYEDDKYKKRRKFAVVAYNELGYNG